MRFTRRRARLETWAHAPRAERDETYELERTVVGSVVAGDYRLSLWGVWRLR